MPKIQLNKIVKKPSNLSKALTTLMALPLDNRKPWKRPVFLIFDYGTTGTFYYVLPTHNIPQDEFNLIVKAHGRFINIDPDEDETLMWLHDQIMPKKFIFNAKGRQAKEDGKWYRYLVPSDKPFGINGDFLVVSTGMAD